LKRKIDRTQYITDREAMKMVSKEPQSEELSCRGHLARDSRAGRPRHKLNLEKSIKILETPFSEVCRLLGLKKTKPNGFLEVENCIFFFDSAEGYVFSSAVIMSGSYGFYGVKIGDNWLETAGKLESQGFKQASELERFTKPGPDFNISVYLYPDDSPDVSSSKVKDYSVCARYGQAL
jgi:hypothetical protein